MTERSLTLAFELAALKRLADPGGAVGAAQHWSDHVGVVSERPAYVVTKFVRDNRIDHDFEPGPEGKRATLEQMRSHFSTDRYVFVGTTDADADLAADVDWEYQSIGDAAEAAGWALTDPDPEPASEAPEFGERRDDWP